MDDRARHCCPECERNRGSIGVAVLHVEKPFSHWRAASPLAVACVLTTLGQRSECEKPHVGDFLHVACKFPRTGENR
jgi:hypothetical protein